MVYLKILKPCPMSLATTVDAIALIQMQSLSLDLSQAMLHQPLQLREGRPNRVHWHQTCVYWTKRCNKRKTGYEALATGETGDTTSVLQNFALSCEAVTYEFAQINLTNNGKRVPSNMLPRSYMLKVSIYLKWTKNWRG